MAETRDDSTSSDDPGASRNRALTATVSVAVGVLAVIIAGVAVIRMVDGERSPEELPGAAAEAVIDVAGFPRGALAGEPAPEMSVALFDGSEFVLSQHLSQDGRPLVVNLWASWCTPCRREIPEFSRVAEANPGVAFLGVAVEDSRGPAEAFATEVGASYPLGIDEQLTVKNGYPFVGLPVTYLIDADGNRHPSDPGSTQRTRTASLHRPRLRRLISTRQRSVAAGTERQCVSPYPANVRVHETTATPGGHLDSLLRALHCPSDVPTTDRSSRRFSVPSRS